MVRLGHFDIFDELFTLQMVCLHKIFWNKTRFCSSDIPAMFNCFPSTKLTKIADNEIRACFANRGGVLQCTSLLGKCLGHRRAFIRCIFEHATVSLSVCLCPLGADAGAVRSIWPLRSPWSIREYLHDQLEFLKWCWRSSPQTAGRSLKHARDLFSTIS